MPRHPVLTDALLDAALGPEPRPDLKASSPRFFHSRVAEALTRAPPWSPYLLHLPLVALILTFKILTFETAPTAATAALVAAGALAWTFVEYWLHRLFFHLRPGGDARRVTSYIVHRHHHAAPADRARLVATPAQSASLALLLFAVYSALAGPSARWPLITGTLLGYLGYELVHYSAHHRRPRTALGRALRRHHLRHHFADAGTNFGISSPLWDLVFRTYSSGQDPEDRS